MGLAGFFSLFLSLLPRHFENIFRRNGNWVGRINIKVWLLIEVFGTLRDGVILMFWRLPADTRDANLLTQILQQSDPWKNSIYRKSHFFPFFLKLISGKRPFSNYFFHLEFCCLFLLLFFFFCFIIMRVRCLRIDVSGWCIGECFYH